MGLCISTMYSNVFAEVGSIRSPLEPKLQVVWETPNDVGHAGNLAVVLCKDSTYT